jgi:hypothetical protein
MDGTAFMPLAGKASPTLRAGFALLGLLCVTAPSNGETPASLEAQFRGCDLAGWCIFGVEPSPAAMDPMLRVRPDGVVKAAGNDAMASAVRDRLNALLASMIHQHKRIVLHDLRALGDGTYAAAVTVNGMNVDADPILLQIR